MPITQTPQTGNASTHQVAPTDFFNLFGHVGPLSEPTFEGIFGHHDLPGASSSSGPPQPIRPVLHHHVPTTPAAAIPPPTVPSFLTPAYLQGTAPAGHAVAYGPRPTMSQAARVKRSQTAKHPPPAPPYAKQSAANRELQTATPKGSQHQFSAPGNAWHKAGFPQGSGKPTRRKKVVVDNAKSFLPFHDITDDPYFVKVSVDRTSTSIIIWALTKESLNI